MKFLRHFLGVSILDWVRNHSVRGKLDVRNIVREIEQYKKNTHTKIKTKHRRMHKNGMSKQVLQYKPEGRRNIGRPCKLWRDQLPF
jgi:hypothetical protein